MMSACACMYQGCDKAGRCLASTHGVDDRKELPVYYERTEFRTCEVLGGKDGLGPLVTAAWRLPNWSHSADHWAYFDADDKPSTGNAEALYALTDEEVTAVNKLRARQESHDMSTDLGPLPDTPFGLFHESPGDDDSEGWQEFIDAPGYTADQMRAERERCYAFGVARERERRSEETRAEVAHLDDDEAQDKLLELAMAAGFKYDGQSLWSATLYGHELLRFMSEVQAMERERMIADGWRQTRYVAPVTECEACLTPDACAIRGQCGHYLRERDQT